MELFWAEELRKNSGLVKIVVALYRKIVHNTQMLLINSVYLKGNLKMFDLKTKQGKLFNALVLNGETLTASQISKRFGIKNPTATVSDIRYSGFAIYANKRTAGNGVKVTEYKHGKASRRIVAAGYKALAMGLEV
jgi:hypothetical protein